jgi:dephospho-CoA kinase
MKIIAFTGMPFSGKSEAVKIAKDSNIPVVRMGDAVWSEVKAQGLELNDKNVGMIADKMRKDHGMDIWARRTLNKIKSLNKTDVVAIDGIRNVEEIDMFKKELGKDFVVIAIDASDETRYKRALSRGRKDDSKNLEKIKERDKRELRWGLDVVIASAGIVISNEGNIDDFRNKIRKTLNEI